jgi:hypothetical protein
MEWTDNLAIFWKYFDITVYKEPIFPHHGATAPNGPTNEASRSQTHHTR